LRDLCRRTGVLVKDTYSSEEVGLIGYECGTYLGVFHVATSNVVVECDGPLLDVDGYKVGKLLITRLHSYATPIIRYEVGDLGSVQSRCPCGHQGPVISHLHGRTASLLLRRDGARVNFFMAVKLVQDVVPVREWRVRQTALDKLIVEIVPGGEVTEKAISDLGTVIRRHFGSELEVEVKVLDSIDWGTSYKRETFRCEI
jgi:phenylacetate-CoA ligase